MPAGTSFALPCCNQLLTRCSCALQHCDSMAPNAGGANLPRQAEVFPDRDHFGRIFYNQVSGLGWQLGCSICSWDLCSGRLTAQESGTFWACVPEPRTLGLAPNSPTTWCAPRLKPRGTQRSLGTSRCCHHAAVMLLMLPPEPLHPAQANMSAAGIPQIAVVLGSCTGVHHAARQTVRGCCQRCGAPCRRAPPQPVAAPCTAPAHV